MHQKGFVSIFIPIGLVILAGIAGYVIWNFPVPIPKPAPEPKVCAQDAKQCPDGSYVGRAGPTCEFAECPGQPQTITNFEECARAGYPVGESYPRQCWTPDGKRFVEETKAEKQGGVIVSLRDGQREGSLLIEKIYPDRITGLNFMEYPVPRDIGIPITLRIGEIASNGCTITLTLLRIEGDTAVFSKKTDFDRPCPICLSRNTLIDTPFGPMPVQDMKPGILVWTADSLGRRIPSFILETSNVSVPPTHAMAHLVLSDGRELLVSPGHPIIDGRTAGGLAVNDWYDGARVVVAEQIAYNKTVTYDILPWGSTGFYWANGILLKSTLR